MKIASHDTQDRAFVIAEVGNNHEGDFGLAKEMLYLAADSGADAVKYQTFRTEQFICRDDEARYQRLKSFELSYDQFAELGERARAAGLVFISTPLDMESAEFLDGEVDAFKIASSDNNFWPLINFAALSGKPVILSTGLAGLPEIRSAVNHIHSCQGGLEGNPEMAVLHCVSAYPTPPEEANIGAVRTLRSELPGCTVGYSDHTQGIDAAVLAVAMGAEIIEKHFTVAHDHSDFRDHQLSADPAEMAELVRRIRAFEVLRGSGEIGMEACERGNAPLIRRSIAAKTPLGAGHRVTRDDLIWVRPGDGIAPGQENEIVGRTLNAAMNTGDRFQPHLLG
ncbi:MAG: N-acetylneuraminate synthase family protein [Minwuia sp.]|uniref:N-acetylneuraminate synthase family protein n=1 Tax=Minwuia sp. TaxID=2493630 RepID=UPI003A845DB2